MPRPKVTGDVAAFYFFLNYHQLLKRGFVDVSASSIVGNAPCDPRTNSYKMRFKAVPANIDNEQVLEDLDDPDVDDAGEMCSPPQLHLHHLQLIENLRLSLLRQIHTHLHL